MKPCKGHSSNLNCWDAQPKLTTWNEQSCTLMFKTIPSELEEIWPYGHLCCQTTDQLPNFWSWLTDDPYTSSMPLLRAGFTKRRATAHLFLVLEVWGFGTQGPLRGTGTCHDYSHWPGTHLGIISHENFKWLLVFLLPIMWNNHQGHDWLGTIMFYYVSQFFRLFSLGVTQEAAVGCWLGLQLQKNLY